MTLNGCIIPKFKLNVIILHVFASYKYRGHTLLMIFLMMRISIENVDYYLFKGMLYCDSLKQKITQYPAIHTNYSFIKLHHFKQERF